MSDVHAALNTVWIRGKGQEGPDFLLAVAPVFTLFFVPPASLWCFLCKVIITGIPPPSLPPFHSRTLYYHPPIQIPNGDPLLRGLSATFGLELFNFNSCLSEMTLWCFCLVKTSFPLVRIYYLTRKNWMWTGWITTRLVITCHDCVCGESRFGKYSTLLLHNCVILP